MRSQNQSFVSDLSLNSPHIPSPLVLHQHFKYPPSILDAPTSSQSLSLHNQLYLPQKNGLEDSQMSILDCSALVVHEEKLNELLKREELVLRQEEVQQMAVKIFQKQLRSRKENFFISKLLKSTPFFEHEDNDVINSDIFTRDLTKNFKCSFFEKGHELFEIGSQGDQFYIILSGSVYCMLPQNIEGKKLNSDQTKKPQPCQNLPSNQSSNNNLRRSQIELPSPQILEHNKKINDSTKYQCESEFLEKEYPHMKVINVLKPGLSFGEIALVSHESKRTATVTFREDSWVLSLGKAQFDHIMRNYKKYSLDDNVIFLKTFPFFSSIPDINLLGLLHKMSYTKQERKSIIFQERDLSGYIFFIKSGDVEISRLQNSFDETSSPSSNNENKTPVKSSKSISRIFQGQKDSQSGKKAASASCERTPEEKQEDDFRQTPQKENRSTWERKDKNKSQKRIVIASLGEGSYFGEEEAQIVPNPLRLSRAICQSAKTQIFCIEKQKLFEVLEEHGQLDCFLSDAVSRHKMRKERISRLIKKEKESREWAIGRKYLEENFQNLQKSMLINSPQSNMNKYFSSAIEQSYSIASPENNVFFTKNYNLFGSQQQNQGTQNNFSINNTSQQFPSTLLKNGAVSVVLEEIENGEEFQRVWSKKKRLADIKSSSKLFTMKKDHYISLVNKIIKESHLSHKKGSLPTVLEKYSFQQTDHTKKSGNINNLNKLVIPPTIDKINAPRSKSSLRENQKQVLCKRDENIIDQSMTTNDNYCSNFINSKEQLQINEKKLIDSDNHKSNLLQENKTNIPSQSSDFTSITNLNQRNELISPNQIKGLQKYISFQRQKVQSLWENGKQQYYQQKMTSSPQVSPGRILHFKRKLDSSTIFNSILSVKQKNFEENLSKSIMDKKNSVPTIQASGVTSPMPKGMHITSPQITKISQQSSSTRISLSPLGSTTNLKDLKFIGGRSQNNYFNNIFNKSSKPIQTPSISSSRLLNLE